MNQSKMKLNESFLVGTTSKVSPCFQFPRQCTNDFSTESFTFQFHGIYEERSFLSFNDSTTHPREREGGSKKGWWENFGNAGSNSHEKKNTAQSFPNLKIRIPQEECCSKFHLFLLVTLCFNSLMYYPCQSEAILVSSFSADLLLRHKEAIKIQRQFKLLSGANKTVL